MAFQIASLPGRQVTQTHEVEIVILRVGNSHSSFQVAKQGDKAIIVLATRAHDPSIRKVLVALLNEVQKQVGTAYAFKRARSFVASYRRKRRPRSLNYVKRKRGGRPSS